ncbi:MAG: CBS domain-containing protein [Caldilineaceae bacterium]
MIIKKGHSRIPVYEESIDHIIGFLYAKDLLRCFREGQVNPPLRQLMRKAYFVPESKKLDELFHDMQMRRVHAAIVVDEYGGTAGLVTIEDLLEEIVGEIQDEYDSEKPIYQQLAPTAYGCSTPASGSGDSLRSSGRGPDRRERCRHVGRLHLQPAWPRP